MAKVRGNLLLIALMLCAIPTFPQEVKVNGGFVTDHFEVGEEVEFWMSARYPVAVTLLLPDSTYDFAPFEYVSTSYYPSELVGGQVVDSVIYRLQGFEVDRVQTLALMAAILREKDTLRIFTYPDSLALQELAPVVSDTTQLKTNLQYAKVSKGFNHILFWGICGVLGLVLTVIGLIFGKKILLAFKLRRLKKEFLKFSDYLTSQIHELKVNPEPQRAEHTMIKWKKYFERLESKPYSKLTSKEILQLGTTDELREPLHKIDRFVYGGVRSDSVFKEFQSLEDFTQHRYGKIIEQLRHGN